MMTVTKLCGLLATMLCCSTLIACTTSSELSPAPVPPPSVATATPPQRSYLDPGPSPPRTGGPSYVRDNLTSSTRQTDFFGNDILPRTP